MAGSWDAYAAVIRNELIPASESNDLHAWQQARDRDVVPIFDTMGTALDTLESAESRDAATTAAATAESHYERQRTVSILLLVAGFIAALGLAVIIARGIVRSINRVRHVCEAWPPVTSPAWPM